MSRLTRDGMAEPVSQHQILRRERGQGNVHFPCSVDHKLDWQPYAVDPYSDICVTIYHVLCMYGQQFQQSMNQPDMVAKPARG